MTGCRMRPTSLIVGLIVLHLATSACAFNALGHKTIAALAWHELPPATRSHIVATLRRHPRYDDDFAKTMPADVDDDAEWIFQHAATWPDIARGLPGDARKQYDHGTWHYINLPIFRGDEVPLLDVNTSLAFPTPVRQEKWNVAQATKYCIETLKDNGPPSAKAQAYCWLLHLVGDMHQPMHSTALFCDRFPTGDRGGNSIKTVQGVTFTHCGMTHWGNSTGPTM